MPPFAPTGSLLCVGSRCSVLFPVEMLLHARKRKLSVDDGLHYKYWRRAYMHDKKNKKNKEDTVLRCLESKKTKKLNKMPRNGGSNEILDLCKTQQTTNTRRSLSLLLDAPILYAPGTIRRDGMSCACESKT